MPTSPSRLRQLSVAFVLSSLATGLAACSSSSDSEDQSASPRDPDPAPPEVSFHDCPAGYLDRCAVLQAPLDHRQPGGPTIDLHIAKYAAKEVSRRQLWLLAGGPGQAGSVYQYLVPYVAADLPDTDVFVIDHRGTGFSHRLTCRGQDRANTAGGYYLDPRRVPACLAELDAKGDKALLPYFTTNQAARDLAFAIQATRAPGQEVVVWGGSYGTHWAHRFVQVAPELPTSVIFDGFMTPGGFSFSEYDRGVDEVGRSMAEGCAADADCRAKMGDDPAATARAIFTGLDERPCDGWKRVDGRAVASYLIEHRLTSLLFPLVHRMARCSATDVAAMRSLMTYLNDKFRVAGASGEDASTEFLNSGIVQYNIALSELWSLPGSPGRTAADYDAAADAQIFLNGTSYPGSVADLREIWPLPAPDYLDLPLPVQRDVPMLWLAGTYDTRTPATQARTVTQLYARPDQPLVMIPGAGHTPSLASQRLSEPRRFCGVDIIESFIRDPNAVDRSCFDDLPPVRWSGGPETKEAFGTDDPWGDDAAAPPPEGGALPAELRTSGPSALRTLIEAERTLPPRPIALRSALR